MRSAEQRGSDFDIQNPFITSLLWIRCKSDILHTNEFYDNTKLTEEDYMKDVINDMARSSIEGRVM